MLMDLVVLVVTLRIIASYKVITIIVLDTITLRMIGFITNNILGGNLIASPVHLASHWTHSR